MEQYQKMKDSGIEWIGEIPEHWDTLSLKHILKIPITDGPHETPNFLDNGVAFISAEAIKNNKIDFSFARYISIEDHKEYSKKCKPQKNDILLVKAGNTTGRLAIVNVDYDFSVWSPLALIRVNDNNLPIYYYYFMNSEIFQRQIQTTFNWNTQPNIGMGQIKNLVVIVPPTKDEQKQIADFLDKQTSKIDSDIQKNQKLIELLKEKRQATINQAVTKGLDPTVPMKDSGIEWIGKNLEHWKIAKLKHFTTKIGSGITPRGGSEIYVERGVPLIRSQNVHFDGLHLDDVVYITQEIHAEMNNTKLNSRDVLLNITGASIGRCTYVPENFEGNVNQHVCIIRTDDELHYRYLSFFIASTQIQTFLNAIQVGASRQGLTYEDIGSLDVIIPPINEQNLISDYLNSIITQLDFLVSKTENQIKKLQEYRQTLISDVVTGKIDVRQEVFA